MKDVSKNIVKEKTQHIINSVNSISDDMPMNSIYSIAPALRMSLKDIDEDIKDYLNKQEIEKLKAGIKAKAKMDDCENYLHMAKNMKIADADEVIEELNELKTWLFLEAEISKSKKMRQLN